MKSVNFYYQNKYSYITYMSILEEKRKIVSIDIEVRDEDTFYGNATIDYKYTHRLGIDDFSLKKDILNEQEKALLIGEAIHEGKIYKYPSLGRNSRFNKILDEFIFKFTDKYLTIS